MAAKDNVVAMVGAFPPPVHGMSVVNEAIKNKLMGENVSTLLFDVSQKDVSRKFLSRVSRVYTVVLQMIRFIKKSNMWNVLYISQSGGKGRIYEIIFIFLAVALKRRIFIHHHSFSYVDKKDIIASIIFSMAPDLILHIVLCDTMGLKIEKMYGSDVRTYVLSNASLLGKNMIRDVRFKTNLNVIGFISNIIEDKGIYEFLDLVEKLTADVNIKGVIAGPFLSEKVAKDVLLFVEHSSNVEYRGACYGKDKKLLFHEIDLLVFPTKYKNEAEPLVIYEAYSHGIPVIAWGRGCIYDMMTMNSDMIVHPAKSFVRDAVRRIKYLSLNPTSFRETSREVYANFNDQHSDMEVKLRNLIHNMSK